MTSTDTQPLTVPPSSGRTVSATRRLLTGAPPTAEDATVGTRRVVVQLVASAVVVLVLVALVGAWAAQRLAEREAVNDAALTADLLAESIVQPALTDGLLDGDPASLAQMDRAVRDHVLGKTSVRVKIWTPQGRILYSDEPALVGRTFALGADEREALANPTTKAEVSDLDGAENEFERGRGPLLEAYRPVWTPSGAPLLFETYAAYGPVLSQANQLWRGFGGVTLSSLLLLLVLLVPVLVRLLRRQKAAQAMRERLLQRALDASTEERRRIAGALHDGVVQDLAATSFAVSGAARQASAAGEDRVAATLDGAAATVRTSIAALRSLLVDIYPPSLASAGLGDALENLAAVLRTRDVEVTVTMPADGRTGLSQDGDRLLFRVAQECLRNVTSHARAHRVTVSVRRDGTACVLTVSDDGIGFDLDQVMADPREGHFGLHVLRDVAEGAGAELSVATAPGAGTSWKLRVPLG